MTAQHAVQFRFQAGQSAGYVHRNLQRPERDAAELGRIQFDEVLAGADDRVDVRLLRERALQQPEILAAVRVVVREAMKRGDVVTQACERTTKRVRVPDAAEGGHAPAAELG